ncbi:hypothetical protein ACFOTA_00475 [Chitinophaga sp. GCM10012297]|uniref:Uncharacterized protein n=1 Tax=Chitinophaga chungangae TaxID=2821488 RepID=A0ABS3Y7M2_9BACT|nr:hypothetical protein [Chitinophaga chungangae]MBO9150665.1 hypothetical protein [Chitinophaga chungangae]
MEKIVWRYIPEFRISIRINGADPGETFRLRPSPASAETVRNYGLLTRTVPGGLVAYMKQHHNGVTWVPAAPITQPILFSFWLTVNSGQPFPSIDFFETGAQQLGRKIFYANNLSAAGAIDANLAANTVVLTAAAAAGNAEQGALSGLLLSKRVTPGAFTQIRAGKIAAGAPVSFTLNDPIAATQESVGLDLRLLPGGAYVVRLEGGAPVEERVVFDQRAAGGEVSGMIDIYKNVWHMAPQPREYSINFLST